MAAWKSKRFVNVVFVVVKYVVEWFLLVKRLESISVYNKRTVIASDRRSDCKQAENWSRQFATSGYNHERKSNPNPDPGPDPNRNAEHNPNPSLTLTLTLLWQIIPIWHYQFLQAYIRSEEHTSELQSR